MLVSSTVTSGNVNTKFRTVVNPVLTWESTLFDDLGMTGTSGTDFGTLSGQTRWTSWRPPIRWRPDSPGA